MMTTNLFVIANVKHLLTGGSFRTLPLFFRTSCGVGVLNSAVFNSFYNRVEFGTILEDLRNIGGGGVGDGFEHPQTRPPLGTPLLTSGRRTSHQETGVVQRNTYSLSILFFNLCFIHSLYS